MYTSLFNSFTILYPIHTHAIATCDPCNLRTLINPHAYTLSLNFIGINLPNSLIWFFKNNLALIKLVLNHIALLLIFPLFTFRSDQLQEALIYNNSTVLIRGVRYGLIHTISAPLTSPLISAVGFIMLATNGYITLANVKLSTRITYEKAVTYIWCTLLVIYLIILYSNSILFTHRYNTLNTIIPLLTILYLFHSFHVLLFINPIIPITTLNIIHAIMKGTIDGLAGIKFVRRRISLPFVFPIHSPFPLFSVSPLSYP